MARPDWLLGFIRKTFPRDMRKLRFTRLPVAGRMVERMFFEGDRLVCLPRDATIQVDREVADPGQMVLPTALVDHVIDRFDFHFLMNFCICRDSMECRDYPPHLGCLFMGEAARGINENWGRPVTREEAKAHIRTCQEKGLIHFVGKSKLDTLWLGVGPGENLFTVCNCCPCCCITRAIPHMPLRLSEKIVRAPGVTVTVTDECVGCGACAADGLCIAGAVRVPDGRAVISDADCRGCGRCAEACPQGAIQVTVDPERFLAESLDQLAAVVHIP
ncbi:MAG: 4Fe-4S binding protein [Proteobacteria bacterium]|nr:4Fe-4S binding protein [Pseudomonadota bacterium]